MLDRRTFLGGIAATALAMATGLPKAEAKVVAQQAVDNVFENKVHMRMTSHGHTVDVVGNLSRASIDITYDVMDITDMMQHSHELLESRTGTCTIKFPLEDVQIRYEEVRNGAHTR